MPLSIEEQIRNAARKAWCDVIISKLKIEEPDYDYVVKLYEEFRTKLLELVLNEVSKKDIENRLDIELFRQMIQTDCFNRNDFFNLVEYSFKVCKSLGSPARDKDTEALKNEVNKEFIKDAISGIALFFLNINICIDWVYEDILKLHYENAEPKGQL